MNSYDIYLQNTTINLLLINKTDKIFQIREFSNNKTQIFF